MKEEYLKKEIKRVMYCYELAISAHQYLAGTSKALYKRKANEYMEKYRRLATELRERKEGKTRKFVEVSPFHNR